MADVTGARGTGNVAQSIRKIDMKEEVLELEPNSYPLTVLTNRLNSDPTVNPEYSWQENALRSRFDKIVGAQTNVQTALPVVDGTKFAQHDLVKVTRTGEVFRVVSIAANTLTVVRGIGGGNVALLDQDEILVVGSAQPEGDISKPARSTNPTKVTNYTQIQKTSFESTQTLVHSNTFTRPNDWARNANLAGIEHSKDWEYTAWTGKPSEDLSGSQPRRTTGGVLSFLSTNITDALGTLTEPEFFGAFSSAFRFGNQSTKTMFASRLVVDVLNGFPRGKLQVVQADKDKTYGLTVMQYLSPHGQLNVITHNLLEGAKYGGMAVILDLSLIKARPLANEEGSRDTHIEQDIQAPDADTRKHQYLTEKGFEVGLEKAHAQIIGVTG